MRSPPSLALWPKSVMSAHEFADAWRRVETAFLQRLASHALPEEITEHLAGIYLPLAAWIHARKRAGGWIIGINGAQGTGKTTLCDFLGFLLAELYGVRVAVLSIDDFYKTREARERLARDIHPLFITRGVPGTHDVELALATLNALETAGPGVTTALPSFDKAMDDRRPPDDSPLFQGRPDLVLLEGWCIGSWAQPPSALTEPVNELERLEDPAGVWRGHVNQCLAGEYTRLWERLDALILMTTPGMDQVLEWRTLQEHKLAKQIGNARQSGLMRPETLLRFIMHYERLTLHTLKEMPSRVDVMLELDSDHRFYGAHINS